MTFEARGSLDREIRPTEPNWVMNQRTDRVSGFDGYIKFIDDVTSEQLQMEGAMKAGAEDSTEPGDSDSAGEMSEEEIDANLEETFPASDPPSWTLGSDHRPAETQKADEDAG